MWPPRSPGPALMRANYEQLRTDMIAAVTSHKEEFGEDVAALHDPGFIMPSPILWAVRGRPP